MIRLSHRQTTILIFVLSLGALLTPRLWLEGWRLAAVSRAVGLVSARAGAAEPAPSLERARGGGSAEERAGDAERELAELRDRYAQLGAELAAARRSLRQIADFKEHHPLLAFRAATVVRRTGGLRAQLGTAPGEEAFIDLGLEDGVRAGDAVLQGSAVLGLVQEAEARAARVLLLHHPRLRIAARLADALGTECYVRGSGEGQCEAVFLGRAPEAARGTVVLTSGLLGYFPAGLVIGELDGIALPDRTRTTFVAPLAPRARLHAVDRVLLLRTADGTGR